MYTFSCVCAQTLSRVLLFATPRNISQQAPLSMGFSQARILEWVASSRGCSWPRDWTYISCVSCIGRQILYLEPPGKPILFHTTVIYLHGKKCLLIINQSYLETVKLMEIKRQKIKKKTLILGFIRHGSYKADALWLQEDFQIFRPQDEILLLTTLCGQIHADHSLVISPTSGPSRAVNRSGSNFWPVLIVANLLC